MYRRYAEAGRDKERYYPDTALYQSPLISGTRRRKKQRFMRRRTILLFVLIILTVFLLTRRSETGDLSYAGAAAPLHNKHHSQGIANEVNNAADTNLKQIPPSNNDVKNDASLPSKPQLPQKILHLTFDDGPSNSTTPVILDILKERNVKATFFLIGQNVRRNPALARRIAEEGHTIGVHTDSHVYRKVYASVDSFIDDFNRAARSIEEATGVQPKIFRFPGGSVNDFNRRNRKAIIKEMNQRGYIYYDWNANMEDTLETEKEAILKSAVRSAAGHERIVMLAHDTKPATARSLNSLLDLFQEYRMEAITPNDKPIQF